MSLAISKKENSSDSWGRTARANRLPFGLSRPCSPSPVAGQVTARWVTVGDIVMTGEPMIAVTDLNDLWVVANVNDRGFLRFVQASQLMSKSLP